MSLQTITKMGPESIWFTSTFGDIPLWNILGSCVVLPEILTYPCVTPLILWGHVLCVAPETSWTSGGAHARLHANAQRPAPQLCENWESSAVLSSRGFCGKTHAVNMRRILEVDRCISATAQRAYKLAD